MIPRKIFLTFLILAATVSTAYASHPKIEEPYLYPSGPGSHRHVTATVSKINSGLVFFRTNVGSIRTFGLNEVGRNGMPRIKPGDQVDLIVDRRSDMILAVAPPHGTGAYVGSEITGTLQHFDSLDRRVTLETNKGKMESFGISAPVVTKLIGIGKGRPVTLEMDGHDRAFDAYRAQ